MGESEETRSERTERQLSELLNEVRVAMPGVQVLFAFLLAVPFQARFGEVTSEERVVYFLALLAASIASACFVAPTAMHRLLFQKQQREYLIEAANRLAIAGLISLAVAMTASTAFVTAFLYSAPAGWVAACASVVLFGALWFALPLWRRARLGAGADQAADRADGT